MNCKEYMDLAVTIAESYIAASQRHAHKKYICDKLIDALFLVAGFFAGVLFFTVIN